MLRSISTSEPRAGCILVTEDDPAIRDLIVSQLSHESDQVMAVGNVWETRAILRRTTVDLLVLDLNLPDGDGLDLTRQLRADGHNGAIMMVTARGQTLDRVLGLELGADDYLAKPFEPRELLARVRNILRRTHPQKQETPLPVRFARFGPWRLDLHHRRLVAGDDRLIILSTAEFRLLSRFVGAPDVVLTRSDLLPQKSATVETDRSIDLQISRLRHKLATERDGDVIVTVRGQGYVMPCPVTFE